MRQIMVSITAAALGAGLAACALGPSTPSEPLAWVRTDGQSGRANPALVDQFAADRAACGIAAMDADNAALQAAEGCMSKHGYALVPASQAEATAAKFRASTAAALPRKG